MQIPCSLQFVISAESDARTYSTKCMLCLVTHRRMTWFIEVFLHVQCLLKQLLALLSLSEAAHDCTQVCESYCDRRMIVLVAFIVDTQSSLKTVPEKFKKKHAVSFISSTMDHGKCSGSLYYRHPWDHMKCPDKRGVFILEVLSR